MSETTAALPGTPTQAELEQIRRYTRRDFAPEELYVFPAVLCDNQIDRDGERFSRDCLRELAELFVGVTGVFDHRASAEGQHARIFAARVVEDPSRPTNCGEPYTALRAEIYMPRNEKNCRAHRGDRRRHQERGERELRGFPECLLGVRRTRRHLLPPAGQTLWGDPLPCDPLRRHRRL